MALPVSIGDLVAVGELAFSLYTQCRGAAADFQDCAELCNHVNLIIQGCRPDKPDSVLREQDGKTISLLADSCTRTLQKFEKMLQRYDSLNSANHKVRETLGFAYSRSELDKIRRRLNEQLLVITAFTSGTRVNTPTTSDEKTPDLFFALFTVLNESRSALSVGGSSVSAQDLENEVEWKGFRDKVALRAGLTSEAVDEKKLYVKGCVKRIEQESVRPLAEQQSCTTSPASYDVLESPSLVLGRTRPDKVPDVTSPAEPKLSYEPSQYPWYSAIGHSYLWKVPSGFDSTFEEPPCLWNYSEDEQWLCRLPEGYSRTATMLYRQKKLEKAYYYSYNNLSCWEGNRPRTSRAYFSTYPFTCDEHLLETQDLEKILSVDYGWKYQFNIATGRMDWMLPSLMSRPFGPTRARWLERPPPIVPPPDLSTAAGLPYRLPAAPRLLPTMLPFVGFQSRLDYLPYDLDDNVTRDMLELMIDKNGPQPPDYDMIQSRLPESWRLEVMEEPHKILYINLDEEWTSTVHPARFHDLRSEISDRLPEGWERRLDSWGNLFYVDHLTKSATRKDPRFNKDVNPETGLPKGWNKIKDHKGDDFYFQKQGRMILGTYKPSSLTTKYITSSQKFLEKEPKDGEKPVISKAGQKLRGKSPNTASALFPRSQSSHANPLMTSQDKSLSTVWPEDTNPLLTEEEKLRWYTMFDGAAKSHEEYITLDEALGPSKAFGFPQSVVEEIWRRSDANHDRRWDKDEYAIAMHILNEAAAEKIKREADASTAHGTRSQQQPHVPTLMSAEAIAQMSSAVRAEPCAPAQPVASNTNRDSHQQLGIEASFADAKIADWS